MEIIMNTEQNHPQQPILKQSFRVPQLLYVKIKDKRLYKYDSIDYFISTKSVLDRT